MIQIDDFLWKMELNIRTDLVDCLSSGKKYVKIDCLSGNSVVCVFFKKKLCLENEIETKIDFFCIQFYYIFHIRILFSLNNINFMVISKMLINNSPHMCLFMTHVIFERANISNSFESSINHKIVKLVNVRRKKKEKKFKHVCWFFRLLVKYSLMYAHNLHVNGAPA